MYFSHTSGIIAAASISHSKPMLRVGTISIVKRIVITMQQAGVFPIVIITGQEQYDVLYELFREGVIFLKMEENADPSMMESVRVGFSYLQDKCDRIVVTPVNVPMFSPDTLIKMMKTSGNIVKPFYQDKGGHPLIFSKEIIPEILAKQWDRGLREVLYNFFKEISIVDVDDPGILLSIHNEQELHDYSEKHNQAILHPKVSLSIEKEHAFFDARLKLLLFLISDTHNVKRSCEAMGLSYSKAWNMLNELEKQVGYHVVERSHGGSKGGKTRITERGMRFLRSYQKYEEELFQAVAEKFVEITF